MPTPREIIGAAATREKPKEANPDEALRQHVQEESPQEFVSTDGHRPRRTPVSVVFPSKRDLVFGDVDDPMIRNRDTVRVTRQVVQDVRRPTEGWFGIDDPIVSKESAEEGAERRRISERSKPTRQRERAEPKRAFQASNEFPAKDTTQHLDG